MLYLSETSELFETLQLSGYGWGHGLLFVIVPEDTRIRVHIFARGDFCYKKTGSVGSAMAYAAEI